MNHDFMMFLFSMLMCCAPILIAAQEKITEFAVCFAHWIMNTFCTMIEGFVVAAGSVCRMLLERRGRRAAGLERSIAALEIQSAKWTEIRMSGGDPLWHETKGWVNAADVCSCGYTVECGVWCGPGHENGRCPAHHGYKIAGGVTAGEFAERIMRGMWDAGGAM